MVEHLIRDPVIAGSNPATNTGKRESGKKVIKTVKLRTKGKKVRNFYRIEPNILFVR